MKRSHCFTTLTLALGFLLAACDSTPGNTASNSSAARSGNTYRPLGSNIPQDASTAPAANSEQTRQGLSNSLGGYAGH